MTLPTREQLAERIRADFPGLTTAPCPCSGPTFPTGTGSSSGSSSPLLDADMAAALLLDLAKVFGLPPGTPGDAVDTPPVPPPPVVFENADAPGPHLLGRATPTVLRILADAEAEARRLSCCYVGTEHLLLAMCGQRSSIAGNVLATLAGGTAAVRTATLELIGAATEPGAAAPAVPPQVTPEPAQAGDTVPDEPPAPAKAGEVGQEFTLAELAGWDQDRADRELYHRLKVKPGLYTDVRSRFTARVALAEFATDYVAPAQPEPEVTGDAGQTVDASGKVLAPDGTMRDLSGPAVPFGSFGNAFTHYGPDGKCWGGFVTGVSGEFLATFVNSMRRCQDEWIRTAVDKALADHVDPRVAELGREVAGLRAERQVWVDAALAGCKADEPPGADERPVATEHRRASEPDVFLVKWLLEGRTGQSSMTMARHVFGVPAAPVNWPRDAGDFGRCVGLLDAVPAARGRLPRMAELDPVWRLLVEDWAALEAEYRRCKGSDPRQLNGRIGRLLAEADAIRARGTAAPAGEGASHV